MNTPPKRKSTRLLGASTAQTLRNKNLTRTYFPTLNPDIQENNKPEKKKQNAHLGVGRMSAQCKLPLLPEGKRTSNYNQGPEKNFPGPNEERGMAFHFGLAVYQATRHKNIIRYTQKLNKTATPNPH